LQIPCWVKVDKEVHLDKVVRSNRWNFDTENAGDGTHCSEQRTAAFDVRSRTFSNKPQPSWSDFERVQGANGYPKPTVQFLGDLGSTAGKPCNSFTPAACPYFGHVAAAGGNVERQVVDYAF
jgi:hypothetical protein